MTANSWNQQFNESYNDYELFKIYLNLKEKRSLEKLSDKINAMDPNGEHPSIETLKLISSKWKWSNRSIDYDCYNAIMTAEAKAIIRYDDLNNRLEWLQETAKDIIDDESKSYKDKITVMERLAKTESILTTEISECYNVLKNAPNELEDYQENKYNFESDKQEDLKKLIADHKNGYITNTEYAAEVRNYPKLLVKRFEKYHEEPLKYISEWSEN